MKTKLSLILPLVFGAAMMLSTTDPASAGSKNYRSDSRSNGSSYTSSCHQSSPSRSHYRGQPAYYSAPRIVYIVYVSSDRNSHSSRTAHYRQYGNDRGYRSHR